MKTATCRGILTAVLITFVIGSALGFGLGFEFGTGLPVTILFMPQGEPAALPENITVKTSEEAEKVVKEAVKGKSYGIGYNCLDYAWSSMRALNWDGQPAAIAVITFDNDEGHALVLTAIKDVQTRWVFLEPQTGLQVAPVPGGRWAGNRITAVRIMVIHWVDFADFELNPKVEVID